FSLVLLQLLFFFFSSRRQHTRCYRDWSSYMCSSDLNTSAGKLAKGDGLMSKVILVNPANASVGYSVITPRWLFVIAGATPTNLEIGRASCRERIEIFIF